MVEPTHLKNTSQIGSFPQVGVKMKNVWVATTQFIVYMPRLAGWDGKQVGWCCQCSMKEGGPQMDHFCNSSRVYRHILSLPGTSCLAASQRSGWPSGILLVYWLCEESRIELYQIIWDLRKENYQFNTAWDELHYNIYHQHPPMSWKWKITTFPNIIPTPTYFPSGDAFFYFTNFPNPR